MKVKMLCILISSFKGLHCVQLLCFFYSLRVTNPPPSKDGTPFGKEGFFPFASFFKGGATAVAEDLVQTIQP